MIILIHEATSGVEVQAYWPLTEPVTEDLGQVHRSSVFSTVVQRLESKMLIPETDVLHTPKEPRSGELPIG